MSLDPEFDRPVFLISSPRSGSTFLFETLARAKDVYTIGDESHGLIEGISCCVRAPAVSPPIASMPMSPAAM